MWKGSLHLSGKLSRLGRLVKAPGHHTIRPKALLDMQFHHAAQEADKAVYENIDPKSSVIYSLANQLRKENAKVVGDKPVKNDAGVMSLSKDSKQKAW